MLSTRFSCKSMTSEIIKNCYAIHNLYIQQVRVVIWTYSKICWIWGSQSDDSEEYSVLCCNNVQFGESPMFQRYISPPSSAKQEILSILSAFAGFLLGLLFSPEDGGDMFFRNVGLALN
jgi:hypothetical protein